MRFDKKRPTVGVDQRVALAAADLLTRVEAARPTGFGRLDALASLVAARDARSFLILLVRDRVRSSFRPRCAALSEAAGRYGDQRIRSKSVDRARRHVARGWFSRSRSVRSLRPFRSSTSHTPSAPAMIIITCSSCRRRIPVGFILRQHRPDLPGHLVGQCDCDQHLRFPCQHPLYPALSQYLATCTPQ